MMRLRTCLFGAWTVDGMRPFDAAELYLYGTIRLFQYLRAGVRFSEYKESVVDAMVDLDHFARRHNFKIANQLEHPDELRNAIVAAQELHSFVRGTLYPLRNDLLNEKHIELLRDCLSRFETALKLDLGALPIYLLEDKRGYSAKQFITGTGARVVLSEDNRELLSPLCLDDIDHAGKCLIHEQYTATGFHVMRAIEEIARRYYEAVTGEKPIDRKGNPFGLRGLANALEGKVQKLSSGGKNTERLQDDILPVLKRIARTYRNPIMHPEMTLKEDVAIEVFDNAKSAIAAILRDVNEGNHLAAWKAT